MDKVLGIVAEYNPFHNGHMYHIQKSKEATGSDYCICVMSGNFTQRGEPSIVDKWSKAYMAIGGGVDLVIELPVVYSLSSAENFASGAIKILNNLKVVTDISFGAECEDLMLLNNIADILYEEKDEYKTLLNNELKKGMSYPIARQNAIIKYLNEDEKYKDILNCSNNILAIEYLKALKRQKSSIIPNIVPRKNVFYNEYGIVDNFASATAIRKFMEDKEYSKVKQVVPETTYQILEENLKKGSLILGLEQYEKEIVYTLRKMKTIDIADLPDVCEGLEFNIKRAVGESNKLKEVIRAIKSKRYTQTRIQRILLYALLDINKTMMEYSKEIEPYIRVLAFNEKGKKLISEIKTTNPDIKIITSVGKFLANDFRNMGEPMQNMLYKDMFATDVYTMGYAKDSRTNLDFIHKMSINRNALIFSGY